MLLFVLLFHKKNMFVSFGLKFKLAWSEFQISCLSLLLTYSPIKVTILDNPWLFGKKEYWENINNSQISYSRLGLPENARHHLCFSVQYSDPAELKKLQLLENHINRCADARKIGDWKSALREIDAAIALGADSSPQVELPGLSYIYICAI